MVRDVDQKGKNKKKMEIRWQEWRTTDSITCRNLCSPKPDNTSNLNYDWGRIGYDSSVARLFARNCGGRIEEDKHYAEFWMGTHVSGPSFLIQEDGNGNMSLKSWILQNPKILGDVVQKWGRDVPFLLKVLSVGR